MNREIGVSTFRFMPFQPLQFQLLQFQPFTLSTARLSDRVPFQPPQLSSNQLITVTKCISNQSFERNIYSNV